MSDFNVPGSRPKKHDEISETDRACNQGDQKPSVPCKRTSAFALCLNRPIRILRFRSFRTQPLANLSAAVNLPIKQRFLGNPTFGNKSWIVNSCYANWVYWSAWGVQVRWDVRPISLLTLSLLTLLDSNFPGNPLWTWEFHPFKSRLCLSQTLWNPQC